MLPVVSHPVFSETIPSTGKPIKLRPMLVKEEKLLLMAKVSEDETDILSAVKQIVGLCTVGDAPPSLTLFDVEYLFLKIRCQSVGDVVSVSYRDLEDGDVYKFDVNLSEVKVKFPETPIDPVIKVNEKAGFKMKYPSADLYEDKAFLTTDDGSNLYKLVAKCIEQLFDDQSVYDPKLVPEKDLVEWVEMLDLKSFEKAKVFLEAVPHLSHTLEYKNKMGNTRVIEMSTLSDFFTLR